jgi:ADP-heptose:LPS heptosyltransferase
LGGPEDKANGDEIASVDDIKIYNACGKFNINESADLVRKAKVIISHDTGLMHIAAAFKKPIISVWGQHRSFVWHDTLLWRLPKPRNKI